MGELIDLCVIRRERAAKQIFSQLGGLYTEASNVIEEYARLMQHNPKNAIERLPEFIKKALDVNPEPAYAAMAGGPNQDWTGPLLDLIGSIYPTLSREQREFALKKVFCFLDFQNYDNAQWQVEKIQEPWLVGDILVTRPLYNPGWKSYAELLQQHRTWDTLSEHLPLDTNRFLLTIPLIQPSYSSLEVRTNFYRKLPTLLDRAQDAIAALFYESASYHTQKENTPFEETLQRKISCVDPLLHDSLCKKLEEKKWIKLER